MMLFMDNYKNILIIKLGALGDWINLPGWYTAVRERWHNACITLMTGSSFLKLAKASPFFDRYIVDNRTWRPWDWFRIIKIIANGHYDLIIDMQRQPRTKKRYYSLSRFITRGPFVWGTIASRKIDLRITPKKLPFTWGKEEDRELQIQTYPADLSFCTANPDVIKLLPQKYVLLIPGCSPNHPYKRWPAESYQQLALKLAKKKIHAVVIGTNAERSEIEQICADNPYAINFCNKTGLLDIPEIATKSMAVVGNDTGPQHMAELSSVPAISLFCDITKSACVKRDNVTNLVGKNIQDISVEQVLKQLQSL